MGEYHGYIADTDDQDGRWRPEIIQIASELRFEPDMDADAWLARARTLLERRLVASSSISQRLKASSDLRAALATPPPESHPARTIHSAKGLEFAAVCVVMTSANTGRILAHLEKGTGSGDDAENARKTYVAASRAKQLLVIAVPKSGASRLKALLNSCGCAIQQHDI